MVSRLIRLLIVRVSSTHSSSARQQHNRQRHTTIYYHRINYTTLYHDEIIGDWHLSHDYTDAVCCKSRRLSCDDFREAITSIENETDNSLKPQVSLSLQSLMAHGCPERCTLKPEVSRNRNKACPEILSAFQYHQECPKNEMENSLKPEEVSLQSLAVPKAVR